MIRVDVGLSETSPGRPPLNTGAVLQHAVRAAANARAAAPDFEFWEVVSVAGGLYTIRRPTGERAAGVECITHKARFSAGDIVLVGFYNRDRRRPYIKGGAGKGNWGPPAALRPGIWDQTWRSWLQDARSQATTAPATLTSEVAWEFATDAGNGWQPEGLLVHKSGRLIHVSRFREGAGVGQEQLRVRLLNPASLPWTVEASATLELADKERTAQWHYPDGACFYNSTDDILTILPGPSWENWDRDARIWTLRPSANLSEFVAAVSEHGLDAGDGYDKRSWSLVGQAGRHMVRFDFPRGVIDRFVLNIETLQWAKPGSAILDYGLFGWAWAGPGASQSGPGYSSNSAPFRNYSAPFTKGKFHTLIARRELVDLGGGSDDWRNLRLIELAVEAASGNISEIELGGGLETVTRTDPAPRELAICNSWAAGYFANTVDTRFPATGDYDEVDFSEHSSSVNNGYTSPHPDAESATIEWTEYRSRRWLGCAFADFEHSKLAEYAWGTSWPSILTPGYQTTVGGVPLCPAGLPTATPNRAWWARAWWQGHRPTPREWPTFAGSRYATRSDCRGMATQDGWRYYLQLLPDEPVWVPDTTLGDKWQNRGHFTYQQDFNTYFEVPFGTVNPSVNYNPARFIEFNTYRRQISYMSPAIRWTWKTVIISISPEGQQYERTISSRFSGIKYPCELTDSEVVIREIEEELSIPENAYQLFTVPRHGLLGVVVDTRNEAMDDPAPSILLLDINDREGLSEKYRINPSQIYESNCLDLVEEDEAWEGPEGDSLDPDYWARAGQYQYTLHGSDESGPQCKVIERPSESLLIVGTQAVQRTLPSGPAGTVVNRTSLFRLNADDCDEISSAYNNSGNDTTHGPRVVRSLAVTSDRIIYGSSSASPVLKQIS